MLWPRHRLRAVHQGAAAPPVSSPLLLFHSAFQLPGGAFLCQGASVPCDLYVVSKGHLSVFNIKISKEAKQEGLAVLTKRAERVNPYHVTVGAQPQACGSGTGAGPAVAG